jgi:hypothetical protein
MTEHLMREIRGIVGDRGLFLIYENAGPDGEDRGARLLRWERQNRPLWTALKPEEYEAMAAKRPRQRFSRDDLPMAFTGLRSWIWKGAGIVPFADRPLSACTVLRRKRSIKRMQAF